MPFPYFGRKGQLAGLYPEPEHDIIVEPFAGSAAYSLHDNNWKREVILVEKDPSVASLWRWLQTQNEDSINGLPDMVKGAKLLDLGFSGDSLTLASLASPSADFNKKVVSGWMARDWPKIRRRVAVNVHKVQHWEIREDDWSSLDPTMEATWFVDPPYQYIKVGYSDSRNTINYQDLGVWCRSLKGLVIACDVEGADWLPFVPLKEIKTINNTRRVEMVYVERNP